MSRPFPLAGLLRLRTLTEDRAASELALARRDQARAEQRARDTAERLSGATLPSGDDMLAFRAAIAGRAALGSLLTERRIEVATAETVSDERAETWSEARQQVRALERLEERHQEAERLEESRAEQKVLDEIAGRRASDAGSQNGSEG
ncbi:flagellar export protein FliJ [Cellulomonas sp. URHD0024]|uniref:flagellar export protein FliJ n=1 Tax=Cellulomonas sp. URHD0024 TaxID=1302620 RepID=UPI0004151515|nr:flagellar export protein FliJ [Cellulomonas sp. URHD0024]